MKLYKITNVVVILLVITAVIQTGTLWLEGTTSHNFFYAVSQMFGQRDTVEADGDVLLATRYAIGSGDRKFSVYYPDDTGGSALLDIANNTLNEILRNVSEAERITADWERILENRAMVLQYDFLVSMEAYLPNYNSLKQAQTLDSFDYIVIVPSESPSLPSSAFFVNSENNECLHCSATVGGHAQTLYESLVSEQSDFMYIATGQRITYSKMISRNLFVPQWTESTYSYGSLREEAYFETDQTVNRTLLENTVSAFFGNFAVDWSRKDESGNYVFSDSSVVVRYLPEQKVLDYYSYASYDSQEEMGLLEGYQICCEFLRQDTSLQTDVYLADVQRTASEWIYYFDYAVDDMPVMLSDSIREKIGSDHAIEITVRNNQVRRYHRYAVNYILSETKDLQITPGHDFIEALNQAVAMYQEAEWDQEVSSVENIYLAYYANGAAKTDLRWFVELYDHEFIIDTAEEAPPQQEDGEQAAEEAQS